MNLLHKYLLAIGAAIPFLLAAQNTTPKLFEKGMVSSSFISQQPNSQVHTHGSVYYDDKWNKGSITLDNGVVITNVPIRFDLANSIVEYKQNEKIEGYSTQLINTFSWYSFTIADSVHFISANPVKSDPFKDVYEVLVEGQVQLYSKASIRIQEPNYLPTLDLGNPEKRIIHEENFFLFDGQHINVLDKKLKDKIALFTPFENEIDWFVKEQKLKCRKRSDLIQLVSYFNHLLRADKMPTEDIISRSGYRNIGDIQ